MRATQTAIVLLLATACHKDQRQTQLPPPLYPAQQAAPPPPPVDRGVPVEAPSSLQIPPSATHTGSGLAFLTLRPGTGAHPGPNDRVTVHYTGWYESGELVDSSMARDEPVSFPLSAVIPGWTEGLQLMVEGEKARLWIPEKLGYGGRAGMPAGLTVWDVELISVTHAE